MKKTLTTRLVPWQEDIAMQVLKKPTVKPMEVIVITLWEKCRSWTRIWEVTSLDA